MKYEGTLHDVEYFSSDKLGATSSCESELRVRVNGEALIDPLGGTETFRFRFVERQPNGAKKPTVLKGSTADVINLTYATNVPPLGNGVGNRLLAKDIKVTLSNGPVSAAGIYPPGKAQAVLVNMCTNLSLGIRLPDALTVKDLTFAAGKYEASLDDVPLTRNAGQATYNCHQEIAAVIDGRWIKSPQNENFRSGFSEYGSPYCQN